MTDFRALCAELLDEAIYLGSLPYEQDPDYELVTRARAALAQPEPLVPTAAGLPEEAPLEHPPASLDRREVAAWYHGHACGWQSARAVLTHFGRPSVTPIPVSERLPGPEDCDAEGKCWWGRPSTDDMEADWFFTTATGWADFCEFCPPVVWLPSSALPLPEGGAA